MMTMMVHNMGTSCGPDEHHEWPPVPVGKLDPAR